MQPTARLVPLDSEPMAFDLEIDGVSVCRLRYELMARPQWRVVHVVGALLEHEPQVHEITVTDSIGMEDRS